MNRWLVALALVMPMAACKMGPDYVRPESHEADEWRLAPATSESIANLPWWELLRDPELQRLIQTALQENQDLRTAVASVEEVQAQLVIARFDLAPSLGYEGRAFVFKTERDTLALPSGGTGGITIPSQVGQGGTLSNANAFAGLKWELDLWGRIRRSIESAHAVLASREEAKRAIVLSLVGNVAEAYFDLRQLDLQVEITKRTLKTWEDTVRLSRIKLEQGVIPKLDLDRFEAERAYAAAQLADLERQVVQKENQFSVLLGRKPARIARGLGLTEQSLPPAVPAGLPSDLLRRRPDILQAEQEWVSATAQIGVAEALRFPQFSLTGALGVANTQLSGFAPGATFAQTAGVSVAGPLLNATALGYQVKVAEARARQAAAQYDRTVVTAFKEVEDALIAVQKSRQQREAQEAQVLSLQSALEMADLRYRGGRASYLDVLTAQRTLFDAELALARTRRNQLTAVVQLYKAVGGGWSPDDVAPTQANLSTVSRPERVSKD
ncbi:RND efflux system, outer membrane factor lipoprotein [Nitrospira tepida]|uniref:RND efflux system, outer membrane factor lipoprotein n=1 Tax=Nitrospira tepida TaxID=2973512 RepID=A0AA86MZW1_9BACT|nr:efflux transporter outer membrane subunit [Nitrospira tepida]CAI4032082.1 RND efflux system, outer membrane factor lipoprotein [Nitrospira tepida]